MKNTWHILIASFILLFTACTEDDLEPTLASAKDVETSISSQDDMAGLINGMYNRFTSSSYYGRDYIIYNEVRSDNCYSNGNSGRFVTPAAMTVGESDSYALNTWSTMYAVIASANIVIALDPAALEGDIEEMNHLVGAAYIGRALAHFDLLKLYGQQFVTVGGSLGTVGIPYVTTYKGEELSPARNTVDEVYTFIMSDLDMALSLMSESLNSSDAQYLSTYAAQALKARVAAYFGDWSVVKTAAEVVINSGNYSILDAETYVASWALDDAANSIFELAYSSTDNVGINGLQNIYRGTSYGDVAALEDILSIFDEGDIRGSEAMIANDGSYLRNVGKYPSADYSDNIPLIRYEEIILLYAESLIEIGDASALSVLNQIPSNRNAELYTEATKANLLLERRKELCFEGFRFNDLARTGSDIPLVDAIRQTHGGPEFGSYNYAFAIPVAELDANSNMVQNENY
ncbi:MAG: RagB/SusD family nutrient uptake outer membrane protein [Thalassobius sp.]|nr:RagB/SusD family nutrient uptake outer membrane protein [Thalassovita sp.]